MSIINKLKLISAAAIMSAAIAGGAMAADTGSANDMSSDAVKHMTAKECSSLKTDADRKGTDCPTAAQCKAIKTQKERKEKGCYVKK